MANELSVFKDNPISWKSELRYSLKGLFYDSFLKSDFPIKILLLNKWDDYTFHWQEQVLLFLFFYGSVREDICSGGVSLF